MMLFLKLCFIVLDANYQNFFALLHRYGKNEKLLTKKN